MDPVENSNTQQTPNVPISSPLHEGFEQNSDKSLESGTDPELSIHSDVEHERLSTHQEDPTDGHPSDSAARSSPWEAETSSSDLEQSASLYLVSAETSCRASEARRRDVGPSPLLHYMGSTYDEKCPSDSESLEVKYFQMDTAKAVKETRYFEAKGRRGNESSLELNNSCSVEQAAGNSVLFTEHSATVNDQTAVDFSTQPHRSYPSSWNRSYTGVEVSGALASEHALAKKADVPDDRELSEDSGDNVDIVQGISHISLAASNVSADESDQNIAVARFRDFGPPFDPAVINRNKQSDHVETSAGPRTEEAGEVPFKMNQVRNYVAEAVQNASAQYKAMTDISGKSSDTSLKENRESVAPATLTDKVRNETESENPMEKGLVKAEFSTEDFTDNSQNRATSLEKDQGTTLETSLQVTPSAEESPNSASIETFRAQQELELPFNEATFSPLSIRLFSHERSPRTFKRLESLEDPWHSEEVFINPQPMEPQELETCSEEMETERVAAVSPPRDIPSVSSTEACTPFTEHKDDDQLCVPGAPIPIRKTLNTLSKSEASSPSVYFSTACLSVKSPMSTRGSTAARHSGPCTSSLSVARLTSGLPSLCVDMRTGIGFVESPLFELTSGTTAPHPTPVSSPASEQATPLPPPVRDPTFLLTEPPMLAAPWKTSSQTSAAHLDHRSATEPENQMKTSTLAPGMGTNQDGEVTSHNRRPSRRVSVVNSSSRRLTPYCPGVQGLLTPAVTESCLEKLATIKGKSATAPPLFIVHPITGRVDTLKELAERLNCYCFGIKKIRQAPDFSVESLARFYCQAVSQQQVSGPYRLAGYSYGGMVAFEMARQLQREGKTVELLLLLDGSPDYVKAQTYFPRHGLSPHASRAQVTATMETHFLLYFMGLYGAVQQKSLVQDMLQEQDTQEERVALAVGVTMGTVQVSSSVARGHWLGLKSKLGKAKQGDKRKVSIGHVADDVISLKRQEKAIQFLQAATIADQYDAGEAERFHGEVQLIRIKATPQTAHLLPVDYGLSKLCTGSVTVRHVDGSHVTIMQAPYVTSVAAAVNAVLGMLGR